MENNNIVPPVSENNNDTINLRELIKKHLNKWPWFLVSIIFCFIIAIFYLKIAHPKYQVQATILLRNQNTTPELSNMTLFNNVGLMGISKEVEDEIQVLSSKTLIKQVIDSLEIQTEYYIKNGLRYDEIYPETPIKLVVTENFIDSLKYPLTLQLKRTQKGYSINLKYGKKIKKKYELSQLSGSFSTPLGELKLLEIKPLENGELIKIITYPQRMLLAKYSSTITAATVNKNSNVISITTVSASPKKAEVILNKLIELYNLDATFDKNMVLSNSADFIENRLKLISGELLDVELNVENYKKKNNLTDISSEAQLYLETASDYQKKLVEIETQINLISYVESYLTDASNQFELLPINIGIQDVALVKLIDDYNLALLERTKILRSSNKNNPVIAQMEQQINGLKQTIISSIKNINNSLKISKNNLLKQESEFISKIKSIPTQERQYLEIKRQQQIKEELYLFLLQKREENALNLASTIPSARIIDAAYTGNLVAPRRLIIFLIALILGIAFPVGIIYLKEILNNTITDRKEFQKLVQVPYLGSIGLTKELDKIVVQEGKTAPIAEMFRLIRTNLQFMLPDKKSPVILITSTISGEGKTFVAVNLAMSFALMKKKVILIGLDIRNPMLDEYLQLPKDKGITIFLSDSNCQIKDIIHPSGIHPYLDVIMAGPIPPNPAELLMNSRLDELIDELRKQYDYIILDTSPIGIVSDTFLLDRISDINICIARQNYSPREVCHLINTTYESKKFKNMAVILNGTDNISSYGYGLYKYHYGKKYKYREKTPKNFTSFLKKG
ncbi:MAG TPA: polysaccharide biosynthesis tyrosine autokinase [Paludibacteraceae bacterium]|nr:polysaccharide biosynthesis tyrosine autokinase [Paludibacteraceae bacterium]